MRAFSRRLPAVAGVALSAGAAAPAAEARLPVVSVTTQREVRNEPKVRARVRVPAGGGAARYAGSAGIEVRGQSSRFFAKRSYALELRGRDGKDRDHPLLGMPADGDWVLYASHNDKTLMRNVVAYDVARRLGRWAARTRHVELRLNGRYQGVYVLMERPELSRDRVAAEDQGPTGAYLLEFTFPFQARQKGAFFRTPILRRPIVFDDPERQDLSRREAAYVQGVFGGAERALYRGAPAAWRAHLDEAAAVDYVLMQELFRNVDAFHGSTYLTKAAGARLALGPVWDFDLSSGNSTAGRSRFVGGWWTRTRDWAERLHRDPRFRAELRARWRELRGQGFRAAVLRSVDRTAARLRGSGAARRNFRRWPVLRQRIFQEPAARGSYRAEVRHLRGWLARRMAWLDRASRAG